MILTLDTYYNYKLIKINDGLIVIDLKDKNSDYFYNFDSGAFKMVNNSENDYKILFATPNLEIDVLPINELYHDELQLQLELLNKSIEKLSKINIVPNLIIDDLIKCCDLSSYVRLMIKSENNKVEIKFENGKPIKCIKI